MRWPRAAAFFSLGRSGATCSRSLCLAPGGPVRRSPSSPPGVGCDVSVCVACVCGGGSFLTARRKVEVSLRTVTSGDAVPLTTRIRPFREKAQGWASRGGLGLPLVQPADPGVSTSETPNPSPPPFVAPQQLPWTPRTPRSRFRPPDRSSMQCHMHSPPAHRFALSAGTSAPACILASACVAASCHQAPCRPPLADVRGRARCFLESTAPHQQSTTHAKPPGTIE